ncbi:MAG: acylphosphatase, partial [bacterium]|nr:acylphosphatase [bacterium]
MKTLHMIVSGRVQGVGFRYFTLEEARAFELTGYVKNLT